MTLPILMIFYVSKWKNNKKHWKIGKSLGVASQNWGWGFFVQRWSLCVNFMTLALLVPEIQRGGPRSPPQSQIDQKGPVWIGLKPVYMRWASPVCLDWPLFTGLVRLMLYFFLKLLLCLYVKAGKHAWRDLGSRNRHLGKQASPPSRIKWKQGMSWTSLVKRASLLANRSGSNHLAK